MYQDVFTLASSIGHFRVNASFTAIRSSENFFRPTVGHSGIWGLAIRPAHSSHTLLDALLSAIPMRR
jgi:hypothetical protein